MLHMSKSVSGLSSIVPIDPSLCAHISGGCTNTAATPMLLTGVATFVVSGLGLKFAKTRSCLRENNTCRYGFVEGFSTTLLFLSMSTMIVGGVRYGYTGKCPSTTPEAVSSSFQ